MNVNHIQTINQHFARTIDAITGIDVAQVVSIIPVLRNAGMVFALGNGGSQSAAGHLVLHLRENGIASVDLLADNPALTAYANDADFKDYATRTLLSYSPMPRDVLLWISGSGTSDNVVAAAHAFKQACGGTVIGISGSVFHTKHEVGTVRENAIADIRIAIPTDQYGPMEDASVAVIHAIHNCLRAAQE